LSPTLEFNSKRVIAFLPVMIALAVATVYSSGQGQTFRVLAFLGGVGVFIVLFVWFAEKDFLIRVR